MRKKLKQLNQQRLTFRATVDRFGTKNGWHGWQVNTICFKDVTHNGELVTDHVWFTCGKWSQKIKEGDKISFEARVGEYEKGYRGYREDVLLYGEYSKPSVDYHLTRPTKVKVISEMEIKMGNKFMKNKITKVKISEQMEEIYCDSCGNKMVNDGYHIDPEDILPDIYYLFGYLCSSCANDINLDSYEKRLQEDDLRFLFAISKGMSESIASEWTELKRLCATNYTNEESEESEERYNFMRLKEIEEQYQIYSSEEPKF